MKKKRTHMHTRTHTHKSDSSHFEQSLRKGSR